MTQSSRGKQAGNDKNQLQGSQPTVGKSTIDHAKLPTIIQVPYRQLGVSNWSLKAKTTVWSCAISMLPLLTIGAATYYMGNQLINEQIPDTKPASNENLTVSKEELQQQLAMLLLATGVTTVLAGAIAAILANRAIRPLLNAAALSNNIVQRLISDNAGIRSAETSKNELLTLEKNISLITKQLPDLLWKQEAEAEQIHIVMDITHRIQECLNEEDVLKTTVEQVRTVLSCDRVTIFRLNPHGEGTFIAESVAFGLPKTLWATVKDPCFQGDCMEKYRDGYIFAIDDIYQAGLTDCHINLLERFAVKANLVAPIIKKGQLFGLLIAHQCSKPRFWQKFEIDLFSQVASQVGFTLNYTQLLAEVDTKANQTQLFVEITRRIRESLNEEDVLKTTVEEVRKTISADRVIVYGFDPDWYGTVIAESVLPGFPKALWAKIKDPCFAEGYVEKYQAGRIQAISNIYEAGLSDCHLQQLAPFDVKANLVAPILKDDKLYGLLIAHQCTSSRDWRQGEIDLFAQIAMQVGFALDHARLLQRIDAEGVRTQLLAELTRRIRESLNEDDVLKTTVEEVRKAISADRVMVYGFDPDWYGTVIAESVLPGFPKALWARIKDPCFTEGYVEKYQAGRVQAISNIHEAGLSDCHLQQLALFDVMANLVAPILNDGQLYGLLIAHQCTSSRDWQPHEIDLLAQVAMQVGFALDRARVLNQIDRAYQCASATSLQERQKQEQLQSQVVQLLKNSNQVVHNLSTEIVPQQMQSINSICQQMQILGDSATELIVSAQKIEFQEQNLNQWVETKNQSINELLNNICTIQKTIVEAAEKAHRIEQPAQKLGETVNLMSNVVSQMKLQAMQTALEASRAGEVGQQFAAIAQKVLSLIQELDSDIAAVQPLVGEIQTETHQIIAAIETKAEQVASDSTFIEKTQQQLHQAIAISQEMKTLAAEITQIATLQAQTSYSANQQVLEVANITNQVSEQALELAESLSNIDIFTQDI
ncbi:GAF domain-containing protein [Calothrix sp. FACHB-1219]|uniref:GAF domain-containing protein n=1 Tax=unclassified Calothrix TaxID=2619626 RepID=UPI001687FB49|nr:MULTISPECIES: GAF domain-containing protein [unclassified Calothrix]MBD2207110.1 GAF domain-containing protein [Calothrix sp. FACHB-168]MBD2221767.1 GAF domain-containing protein [Calothrix sp. FACHB-1219]